MRTRCMVGLMLLLCLTLLSIPAAAQTVTGNLSGHVADKTGAFVPNVKVTAVNTSTGAVRETTTNQDGYFLLSFLAIGNYDVTAASTGFRTMQKKGVVVELNNTTVSDFALDIAAIATEIDVRGGEIPLVDTTSGDVKTGLDEQQVFNTPITGRNFISLVEQVPGFQPSAFNSSSNNPTNSTGSYAAFSGQGTRSSTFQIDGVNNDDSSENQNRQNVNISAIKEFKVLTNSYSAEFGRAGGAVVLVQTKSGSNSFHGDGYDYIQNDIFNANDFFNNMSGAKRPPVRRNQYGGTIGGPVIKNKVFFFVSVERVKNVGQGSMDRFTWLPSDTPHACAAGEVSRPGGPYCVNPATHPNIQRDLAFMKSVMDLWNTPELQGKTPNDPAACAQMIASGRANRCVTVTGIPWTQPDSDYSGKMDWNASTNTNMNLRYQYSRQIRLSSRIIKGDNYGSGDNRQYNIAYTLTHVFSPRQTGEFRYGFGNRATNQGVTDGNDIPTIRFSGTMLYNPAASSDTLAFPGTVIGTSTNVPINRRQRDHQFVYNHMLVMGRHTFKIGIDQRIQALDDVASGTQRGYWTFSSPYTSTQILSSVTGATAGFAPWEMFLMGYVGSYSKGYGDPYAENRFHETNLYMEDSFRVTPNLTLTLGSRWEGVSAPHEIHDRFSYGYGGDWNNVEPRVGFAWTPGFLNSKPGDFVIRGGYGIYHSRVFQSIFSQSGLNYRFQPPNGFTGGMGSPCSTNNSTGSVVAPGQTFSVTGAPWEISDPSCGYQFTKGTISPSSYTGAYTANGVKYAGGVLNTTLLIPDKNFHLPYVSQWNLTIEKQLPWKMALSLAYTGNRGIGLPFYSGINDARFPQTSPLLTADIGGGVFRPVVFDRVCKDYSDPICVVNNTNGTVNTSASGALRTFTSMSSTSATLAQKGIVIDASGTPHGYISLNSTQASLRRPDPTIGRNYYLSNFAFTYYNAMVIKLTKQMSNGLSFSGWWTWSKTMDTGSEATTTNTDMNVPVGSVNPQQSLRALSAFHQPQRFVISYAYDTPWFKNQEGFIGRVLGGWTLSGVTTFASGLPFSVAAPDLNMDGVGGDYPVILDPSVVGRSIDDGHSQNPCPSALSAGRCFDTLSQLKLPYSAFLPNGNAYVGDNIPLFPGQNMGPNVVRRNSFFEQGQKNTDLAVNKNIRIAERFKLAMRFELYNAFNRVTFNRPAGLTVSSTSTPLGRISSTINLQNYVNSARTSGARMGQLALRLTF